MVSTMSRQSAPLGGDASRRYDAMVLIVSIFCSCLLTVVLWNMRFFLRPSLFPIDAETKEDERGLSKGYLTPIDAFVCLAVPVPLLCFFPIPAASIQYDEIYLCPEDADQVCFPANLSPPCGNNCPSRNTPNNVQWSVDTHRRRAYESVESDGS